MDLINSTEVLRIQNAICSVKNIALGDVHIDGEGTMIIHQNTSISHLDIMDGIVLLEDEGMNLRIPDGIVWSGGEIRVSRIKESIVKFISLSSQVTRIM